jgi:hypothetical protein
MMQNILSKRNSNSCFSFLRGSMITTRRARPGRSSPGARAVGGVHALILPRALRPCSFIREHFLEEGRVRIPAAGGFPTPLPSPLPPGPLTPLHTPAIVTGLTLGEGGTLRGSGALRLSPRGGNSFGLPSLGLHSVCSRMKEPAGLNSLKSLYSVSSSSALFFPALASLAAFRGSRGARLFSPNGTIPEARAPREPLVRWYCRRARREREASIVALNFSCHSRSRPAPESPPRLSLLA